MITRVIQPGGDLVRGSAAVLFGSVCSSSGCQRQKTEVTMRSRVQEPKNRNIQEQVRAANERAMRTYGYPLCLRQI
jgi:hypothetical protein